MNVHETHSKYCLLQRNLYIMVTFGTGASGCHREVGLLERFTLNVCQYLLSDHYILGGYLTEVTTK